MKKDSEQKQTTYNLISSFLIGGITFLTAPVFTRLLGPEQYGIFSVAFSWVTLLVCIMGFQAKEALATGHLDFQSDYLTFRNSSMLLGTIISVIEVIFFVIFLKRICQWTGYSPGFIVILIVFAFSQQIFLFVQQALIFEKRAQINLLLSVSLVSLIVICSLIFISKAPEGEKYYGRMLGFALPYSLYAVISWAVLFFRKPVGLNFKYWKYTMHFGIPIVFHALSREILAQSDKVMMQFLDVDTGNIGIYSFFFALTGILGTIREALNASWRPFYYDYLYNGNYDLLREKCRNHIELFAAITGAFLLLAREVSLLMAGKAYLRGIYVLPVLVICAFFTFVYQFPVNFELYYKKTEIVAIGTVIAALINIFLNAVLIPIWGMVGAGVASAISYLILSTGHLCVVSYFMDRKYHLKASSFLPGISLVLITCGLFFLLERFWLIRWIIAAFIVCFELIKIRKRKSIF